MIRFNVYGTPIPKGSVSVFKGRVVQTGGAALRRWEKHVRASASAAVQSYPHWTDRPLYVGLTLVIEKPKSIRGGLPWKRPDIDKLARAVLDGLSGVLFDDDARVVDLMVRKRYQGYAPDGFVGTGVLIEAMPLDAAEGG